MNGKIISAAIVLIILVMLYVPLQLKDEKPILKENDDNQDVSVIEKIEVSKTNTIALIFPSKSDSETLLTVMMRSESFPPNVIHCISNKPPTSGNTFPTGKVKCLIIGKIIYKNGKPIGHETIIKTLLLTNNLTKT